MICWSARRVEFNCAPLPSRPTSISQSQQSLPGPSRNLSRRTTKLPPTRRASCSGVAPPCPFPRPTLPRSFLFSTCTFLHFFLRGPNRSSPGSRDCPFPVSPPLHCFSTRRGKRETVSCIATTIETKDLNRAKVYLSGA